MTDPAKATCTEHLVTSCTQDGSSSHDTRLVVSQPDDFFAAFIHRAASSHDLQAAKRHRSDEKKNKVE